MRYVISGNDCKLISVLIKTIPFSECRVCQAENFLVCAEQNNLSAQRFIWLYSPPWQLRDGVLDNAAEALRVWQQQAQAMMGLRQKLGNKLTLINTSRISAQRILSELGEGDFVPESVTEQLPADPALNMALSQAFALMAPEYWDTYESLELASWLPEGTPDYRAAWPALLDNDIADLLLAVTAVAAYKQSAEESPRLVAELECAQLHLLEANQNLALQQAENARLAAELELKNIDLVNAATVKLEFQTNSALLKQEHDLLLVQLHQLQEELEVLHQEKHQLETTLLPELAQTKLSLSTANVSLQQQTQLASALALELESSKAYGIETAKQRFETATDNAALKQENTLLLARLHQVQEEFEVCYQDNQATKDALITELAASKQSLFESGAALEQKTQMAAKHAAELQQKQSSLTANTEQLNQQSKAIEALSAELASAKLAAAEASKQRVSLADSDLKQENELLLNQLHQVQEELEALYLAGQGSQPVVVQVPVKPIVVSQPKAMANFYGSADRVKQHLSYRLGATLIKQSDSFGAWLGLPAAISKELRLHKQRQIEQAKKPKLPPIAMYRDAHEAEKVKQHLSYRLGSIMLANSKSPLGWIKMPFALIAESGAFKRERVAASNVCSVR